MNIVAFTKYSYEGPSSRYRFYNYKQCFKNHNINLTIRPLFLANYFKKTSKVAKVFIVLSSYVRRTRQLIQIIFLKNYDLVLIEYELLPFFPAIFEYLLSKRGIKYIVDYDDAIFHKYDMSDNRFIRRVLANKIPTVIKHASRVIACNSYLKAYAQKHNQNILMLPTVVQLDKYQERLEAYQRADTNKFIIGWIGSRTTSVYILEILPAIQRFVAKYPDTQFNLIGFDEILLSSETLKQCHIEIIPWAEETEIDNILAFDVGIMPLRNDPWSRGKCGFKLVQYMSCKKAVIASPVGINSEIVKNGINGFLVTTIDEWFRAFETLYLDENLRAKMSQCNLDYMLDKFNSHKNCSKYITLIQEL